MIDFFVKGGPLMWPILLCSVIALALILAKALQFYGSHKWLSADIETLLAQKPAEVAELIEAVRSGAGREQLSLVGTRQVRELEKGLGVLALIASIAPLLGLTGTVTGMIQALMSIASHSGSRVEPSMVAGGDLRGPHHHGGRPFRGGAHPRGAAFSGRPAGRDRPAHEKPDAGSVREAAPWSLNAGIGATAGSISPPWWISSSTRCSSS
jgi:biopolymer transport protein ExbB